MHCLLTTAHLVNVFKAFNNILCATIAVLITGSACDAQVTEPIAITISCGTVGTEFHLCNDGVKRWEHKQNEDVNQSSQHRRSVSVVVDAAPTDNADRLKYYKDQLEGQKSGSNDIIDVFQIDVVWVADLAEYFLDLEHFIPIGQYDRNLIENNTITRPEDKSRHVVAIPWWADKGLLYERADLLEKYGYGQSGPQTWDELTKMAEHIQNAERECCNPQIMGFVWSGADYEGLTCNAIEWISSFGGKIDMTQDHRIRIIDDNGHEAPGVDATKEAISMARSWIHGPDHIISSKDVLDYKEDKTLHTFLSRNAVFMRHWPYAWAAIRGDIDPEFKTMVRVRPLPTHPERRESFATMGGWELAVSKWSKNRELAIDLVEYLSGETEQELRAVYGEYIPTIHEVREKIDKKKKEESLYGGDNRMFENITQVLRPSSVGKYTDFSLCFSKTIHQALSASNGSGDDVSKLQNRSLKECFPTKPADR